MTQDGVAGPERQVPQSVAAESASPSPYLQAGEAVPEAYPAPPQPGQPRYGTAPAFRSGQRTFRPGPPGFDQPHPDQRGYGQPGQTVNGRAARGQARRRDPALAAPWERAVASILDWALILAASLAIFLGPLLSLARQMQAILTHYQGQNPIAAQTAMNNLSRDPSTLNTVLHMQLAAFGIALAYFWIGHAAWGTTLGKRAVGLRVVTVGEHARIGVRTAGIRAVTFLVGPAVFLLTVVPLNFIGGALWLADAIVGLADPQTRSLHDRLAGTIVVKKRWLDQQGRDASGWPG